MSTHGFLFSTARLSRGVLNSALASRLPTASSARVSASIPALILASSSARAACLFPNFYAFRSYAAPPARPPPPRVPVAPTYAPRQTSSPSSSATAPLRPTATPTTTAAGAGQRAAWQKQQAPLEEERPEGMNVVDGLVWSLRLRVIRAFTTKEGQMLWGVIGVNTLIFFAWNIGVVMLNDTPDEEGEEPQLKAPGFMERHFTVSLTNMENGRYWTLITSSFSHVILPHFAFDMFLFYFYGKRLLRVVGPLNFITIYLAAAPVSALAAVLQQRFSQIDKVNLGSMGPNLAVMTFLTALWSNSPVRFIGVPIKYLALAFPVYEVWSWYADDGTDQSQASDVASVALGLFSFWRYKRVLAY